MDLVCEVDRRRRRRRDDAARDGDGRGELTSDRARSLPVVITAQTKAGRAYRAKIVARAQPPGPARRLEQHDLQRRPGDALGRNYAIYWEPSGHTTTSSYKNIIDGFSATWPLEVAPPITTTRWPRSTTTAREHRLQRHLRRRRSRHRFLSVTGLHRDRRRAVHHQCPAAARGGNVVTARRPMGARACIGVLPAGCHHLHRLTGTECSGSIYCAYHSSISIGPSTVLYANMPYDGVSGCESGESPNGDSAADRAQRDQPREHRGDHRPAGQRLVRLQRAGDR